MTDMANKLTYDREVIRVWFCNKRQALKNNIKKIKVCKKLSRFNCESCIQTI